MAVTSIIPYTGTNAPIPSDILDNFQSNIALYASIYVVLAGANFLLMTAMYSCCSFGAFNIASRINKDFLSCLVLKTSYEAMQRYPTSYLATVLQYDSANIKAAFGSNMALIISYFSSLLSALIYAYIIGTFFPISC